MLTFMSVLVELVLRIALTDAAAVGQVFKCKMSRDGSVLNEQVNAYACDRGQIAGIEARNIKLRVGKSNVNVVILTFDVPDSGTTIADVLASYPKANRIPPPPDSSAAIGYLQTKEHGYTISYGFMQNQKMISSVVVSRE
jgi:hypothetical protein